MVTLLLSPEKESDLHTSVTLENRQRAKEILVEAIEPTLDALLAEQKKKPRDIAALIAELDRIMDKAFEGREPPQLPDEALTRAGIYGDHD
jgi:hypothetical protein